VFCRMSDRQRFAQPTRLLLFEFGRVAQPCRRKSAAQTGWPVGCR
jgi:hypothetical protein